MIAETVAELIPGLAPGLVPGFVPEHLGKLHPFEHAVVLLLAFGPVLLLAVTIKIARGRIDDEDPAPGQSPDPSED